MLRLAISSFGSVSFFFKCWLNIISNKVRLIGRITEVIAALLTEAIRAPPIPPRLWVYFNFHASQGKRGEFGVCSNTYLFYFKSYMTWNSVYTLIPHSHLFSILFRLQTLHLEASIHASASTQVSRFVFRSRMWKRWLCIRTNQQPSNQPNSSPSSSLWCWFVGLQIARTNSGGGSLPRHGMNSWAEAQI